MLELLVSLLTPLAILASAWVIKTYVMRDLERKYQAEKKWLIEKYIAEKQDLIDNLPRVADIIFEKIRGTVGGLASGAARLDKGLAQAVATDVISGTNPIVGMILEQFPSAKKYVAKNPAAVAQLLSMVGGMSGGKALNTGTSNTLERLVKGFRYG